MSSSSAAAVTPHESVAVFLPTTLVYTAVWSCLFLLYQRLIVPQLLHLSPATSAWYSSLTASKQRHYVGRLLFTVHHLIVAYYAIVALTASSDSSAVSSMRAAMYHEVACDMFDVAVIAFTERGFTGLHWQGLLLHHLLSILAILTTFTLHTPLSTTAQLALLLDGTGATDYLFNTLLFHTPLIERPVVLLAASFCTLLFFATRLLYFPWLAWLFIYSGWHDGGLWTAAVCAAIMALTCFFNVGMVRTRWRQHRGMWQLASYRSNKANKQQYEEREMDDTGSITL